MTNIWDVAKLAGVAPITVSRVINGAGNVAEDTRQRVQQAIDQLHYVPNTLARSLRSRQSRTIALIVSDITNPFWTTVVRGVEDSAAENDYRTILWTGKAREVVLAPQLIIRRSCGQRQRTI